MEGCAVGSIHILSLPTVYAAVYDELLCEVTCIVHAIIYWLSIWLVWGNLGDCGVRVVGKMSKDIVVRSYLVWLLFGDSIHICLFIC